MRVRARTKQDLAACVEVVRATHDLDGYPAYMPDDLLAFLDAPDCIGAWVAESAGAIVGHVALHPASSTPVMDLVSEFTGLPAGKFGVVARLFVSPRFRGRGVGSSLLQTAASRSVERGLRAMLDVHAVLLPAIRLYERSGWVRVGAATAEFPNGATLEEFVYLAPDVEPRDECH